MHANPATRLPTRQAGGGDRPAGAGLGPLGVALLGVALAGLAPSFVGLGGPAWGQELDITLAFPRREAARHGEWCSLAGRPGPHEGGSIAFGRDDAGRVQLALTLPRRVPTPAAGAVLRLTLRLVGTAAPRPGLSAVVQPDGRLLAEIAADQAGAFAAPPRVVAVAVQVSANSVVRYRMEADAAADAGFRNCLAEAAARGPASERGGVAAEPGVAGVAVAPQVAAPAQPQPGAAAERAAGGPAQAGGPAVAAEAGRGPAAGPTPPTIPAPVTSPGAAPGLAALAPAPAAALPQAANPAGPAAGPTPGAVAAPAAVPGPAPAANLAIPAPAAAANPPTPAASPAAAAPARPGVVPPPAAAGQPAGPVPAAGPAPAAGTAPGPGRAAAPAPAPPPPAAAAGPPAPANAPGAVRRALAEWRVEATLGCTMVAYAEGVRASASIIPLTIARQVGMLQLHADGSGLVSERNYELVFAGAAGAFRLTAVANAGSLASFLKRGGRDDVEMANEFSEGGELEIRDGGRVVEVWAITPAPETVQRGLQRCLAALPPL